MQNDFSDYLSWVLSDKSPLHKNCKVHILSNPEFDFWTDMVDKDDGYIGIKTEGKYKNRLQGQFLGLNDVLLVK